MNVACPHCRGEVENRGDIALKVIGCPHCRRQFQMPAFEALIVPQAQPLAAYQQPVFEPQQPVVFINTSPRRERRLRSGGWFARSFATTAGILLCMALFFIGVPVLMCGGCFARYGETVAKREEERREVKKRAARMLSSWKIDRFADESMAYETGLGGWTVSGKAFDKAGNVRDVRVEMESVTDSTNKQKQWQVTLVILDGEKVFEH